MMNVNEMELTELLSENTMYNFLSLKEEQREQFKLDVLLRVTALTDSKELIKQIQKTFKGYETEQKKIDKKLQAENNKSNNNKKHEIDLHLDKNGKPSPTIKNFFNILKHDPKFKGLSYNLLNFSISIRDGDKYTILQDFHDSDFRAYIEEKYNIYSREKLEDALKMISQEQSFHPVKEIIENVEWDGKDRIKDLFIKYLKCEDSEYTREITRLVFAGGINRLYRNGCKFDDVIVFVGTKQGEGKSTFVRWLALKDEFFNEITEMDGQKGVEALEGSWICEIAELLALTKAKEVESVKSYITKTSDKYRRPYEKRISENKRQCIFLGTTNKTQFLTDKTGNRRWYPLVVNSTGYELFEQKEQIKKDILQCWAQAKALYDKNQLSPYMEKTLTLNAKEKQSNATEDDYRVGLILEYLIDKNEICILELWKCALSNDFIKPSRRDSNDIALILQSMPDWNKSDTAKRFHGYGLQRFWYRIDNNSVTNDLNSF